MKMYIIIVIFGLIMVYIIEEYNKFVKLRNGVKEAFSTMDVYLRKRWDLIPNLVEVVKGYATHESSVFGNIAKLRSNSYSSMSLTDKIDANQELASNLGKIMAIVENYPELKANENFLDLTKQLTKVEEDIANARKYYNAVVKKLNTKIEMFPSNIIASIFKFEPSKMFEASAEEKNNVKVEL